SRARCSRTGSGGAGGLGGGVPAARLCHALARVAAGTARDRRQLGGPVWRDSGDRRMSERPDVGDMMPDVALEGMDGAPLRPSSFHGRKWVLWFYPKDDTPGCTS